MSALLALAAVAAPGARPAPPPDASANGELDSDRFASELTRARTPAQGGPAPAQKGNGKTPPKADAARPGPTAGTAGAEREPAAPADEPGLADERTVQEELASWLPAWPAPSTAALQGQPAATRAASAASTDADPAHSTVPAVHIAAGRDAGDLAGAAHLRQTGMDLAAATPTGAPAGGRTPANETGLADAVSEARPPGPAQVAADSPLPDALPPLGLLPAASTTAANAMAAPVLEGRIAAALDSAAFAPALATQVTWLVQEGVQQARLSLNPVETGPLTVRIVLDGTQARIDFGADLAGTRSAIEASLPALAAALNDSGLTLAGGGVFDGQARDGTHGERSAPAPGPGSSTGTAPTLGEAVIPLHARTARGLVDLVA